ncbi:MAG TPA: peroxiredoxin [Acidimicrobiales bacterium]|nr:peroxiredoxin [Acidimicrobiales bacterium]
MNPGDLAPDFTLSREDGTMLSLSDQLTNGPVVLFFYPKAMTSGCTAESCHFRDMKSEFAELGATRIGISADKVAKQKQFSDKHGFDYPLLSDPDRKVAAAYGVKRPGPLFNKRATFVIGADQRLIAVITSELNMDKHADEALSALRNRNGG